MSLGTIYFSRPTIFGSFIHVCLVAMFPAVFSIYSSTQSPVVSYRNQCCQSAFPNPIIPRRTCFCPFHSSGAQRKIASVDPPPWYNRTLIGQLLHKDPQNSMSHSVNPRGRGDSSRSQRLEPLLGKAFCLNGRLDCPVRLQRNFLVFLGFKQR